MTTTAVEGARRAGASSVCSAPNCTVIITPGSLIIRIPGRGFAHAACARAASSKEDRCD